MVNDLMPQHLFVILRTMYKKKVLLENESGARITILVLGGKWKPQIIQLLADKAMRPSELMRALPDAGARVINQQLSGLMEYGIVERHIVDTTKPCSVYCLTQQGMSLLPLLQQMEQWGNDFRKTFNDATQYVALSNEPKH